MDKDFVRQLRTSLEYLSNKVDWDMVSRIGKDDDSTEMGEARILIKQLKDLEDEVK